MDPRYAGDDQADRGQARKGGSLGIGLFGVFHGRNMVRTPQIKAGMAGLLGIARGADSDGSGRMQATPEHGPPHGSIVR